MTCLIYIWLLLALPLVMGEAPFSPHPVETEWSEDWPHSKKLSKIWMAATGSQDTKRISRTWPTALEFLRRFTFGTDDFRRLQLPATFRPYSNTVKVLHTLGSSSLVNFVFTDNKYSGIFSDKSAAALMTASTGTEAFPGRTAQFGWGFKFFRTKTEPAHILTLNTINAKSDYNMFKQMTCNHSPLSTSFSLYPQSRGWTLFPGQNGLSNVARANKNGQTFDPPIFPYALCFTPRKNVADILANTTMFPHPQMQFRHVPVGAVMFDIVAIDHPIVLEHPELLKEYSTDIGQVRLMSHFITSAFIDERLFVQHQAFEEDLVHRPDWIPYMTAANLFSEGPLFAYRSLFQPDSFDFEELDNSVKLLLAALNTLAKDPKAVEQYFDSSMGFDRIRRQLDIPVSRFQRFANDNDTLTNITAVRTENIWPDTPESNKLQQIDMHEHWMSLLDSNKQTLVNLKTLVGWAEKAVASARDDMLNLKSEGHVILSRVMALRTVTGLTASIQDALAVTGPTLSIKSAKKKCPFQTLGHGFMPRYFASTDANEQQLLSTHEALNLIELVGMLAQLSR